MMTKQCTGPCQRALPATTEHFYRDASTRCGLQSRCKACHVLYVRSYADRVQARLYQQRYYMRHMGYYADYRETRREANRVYQREYYQANKGAILARRAKGR